MVDCNDNIIIEKENSDNVYKNEEFIKLEPKYESDFMIIDSYFDEINGNIKHIGYGLIITNDNKIYASNSGDIEFVEQLDDDVTKFVSEKINRSTGYELLQKSDGTYIYYQEIGNIPKEKLYFDIDNLIFLTYSYAITLEDNNLFLYEINNGRLDDNKRKLYIDIDDIKYDEVQIANLSNGSGTVYLKLSNELIYEINLKQVTDNYLYYHYGNGYIDGNKITKVYADFLLSFIYSVEADDKNLYKSDNFINGEKFLELPDDYVISDIKNIYYSLNELIIEMQDGEIYYLNNNKLVYSQELSELNKNSSIKGIVEFSNDLIIIGDDGYAYKIK